MKKYLECLKCGKKYELDKDRLSCKCHNKYYGSLQVKYDYESINNFPLSNESGIRRYLPLLPISELKLKMHEIKTPLFKIIDGLFSKGIVYVKDESKNPTGSFKDKESIILINKAIEFEIKDIYCVSSGNAANSLSAFARLNNIKCTCFLPETALECKKDLIKLHGGNLSTIGDNYEDCYRKVIDFKCDSWNACSGINPYNLEGNKITAFEIFEEIGVPEKIIVPCGNGTNLAGIFKGFYELRLIGKTNKIPQMIGVQIEGADPIAKALEENKEFAILEKPADSIAESIVASESYSSAKAVAALKKSKGFIVKVKDEEIKESLIEILDNEGLLIEPSSASVFAALKKIEIKEGENVVCIATGSGIKMIEKIKDIARRKL